MQFVQYLCTLPSNDTYGYIQALPLAKVYVYVWDPVTGGNGAPALLYDDLGGAISNPVIADTNGFAGFAAEDGIYNIQVTDADGVRNAPLAVAVQFFDQQDFAEVAGIVGQAVIGPNSSADGHIPQFDGATGNKVKDNGLLLDTDGTLGANSDTRIPSQKAVKTAIAAAFGANDAMIFKGVIDCSGNPNYPAADAGHTYRVSGAGKIGGASGLNVEVGDLLICLTDGTVSGNQATVGTAWTIVQANIDGAVVGPASAADGNLAMFNGTTGKLLKDGGNTLANPLVYPNGSAAAPSAVWNTNSGLFWDPVNAGIGISIAATQMAYISAGGIGISSNSAAGVNVTAYLDSATNGLPILSLIKGGGSVASPTVPLTGYMLGVIRFRGYTATGPTVATGADISAIVEETTWSTTANGSYLRIRACALGSSTLTEIARWDVASGLQMFGANPVIDADRAFRLRSTTVSGAITPAAAGRLFFHSDAQGGAGEVVIDTGSGYCQVGQAAVKHLTTGDTTYTPRVDGRIIRDNVALGADHGLTLLTTNVTDGHTVKLSRRGSSGGFNRKVYQADGATLIVNVADNGNAEFVYDGVAALWFQV